MNAALLPVANKNLGFRVRDKGRNLKKACPCTADLNLNSLRAEDSGKLASGFVKMAKDSRLTTLDLHPETEND